MITRAFGSIGGVMPSHGRAWTNPSSRFPAIVPAATALSRLRKLIDELSRFRRKLPGRRSPETAPDGAPHYNPWEDPALWLLMWH